MLDNRKINRLAYLKNDFVFGFFKNIVVVEKYPYSLELDNLIFLDKYGEDIIISIHDPEKYWLTVKSEEENNRFPGVTIQAGKRSLVTFYKESFSSIVVEYKTEADIDETRKVLVIRPEQIDNYFNQMPEFGFFNHPVIPENDEEFFIYCLNGKNINVHKCNKYPQSYRYDFTRVEKETCIKEHGYRFSSAIDIEDNILCGRGTSFKGSIPGVSISAKGNSYSTIQTEIKITKKANFPILITMSYIDYRKELDNFYSDFNTNSRENIYYIYYDTELLNKEFKEAVSLRDYAKIDSFIQKLFKRNG